MLEKNVYTMILGWIFLNRKWWVQKIESTSKQKKKKKKWKREKEKKRRKMWVSKYIWKFEKLDIREGIRKD